MSLAQISIDDKFKLERGRVLLSGTQALVRAALMQRARDRQAGLDTAGYISGYRGSPLGGLDLQLARAKALLGESDVHFEPGLNEDLAATAVLGTQQANALPTARHDGVFGMWYGKGPGVDRSGDALKHCNYFGTSRHGGVLAVFGDDHPGKSSTVAHQSEQAMVSFAIPVLYPATIQEYLDYALTGWALSRYSGLWVGFKCVNETVENTATVNIDPDRVQFSLPELANDDGYIQLRYAPQEDDLIVQRVRMPRVQAFAAANPIDRRAVGERGARLGVVTSGKAYLDVMQALEALGIDEQRARALGLSVYKVGLCWPLHDDGLRAFAEGLEELLFIEEKRPFLEPQAANALYNLADRPHISGKATPGGVPLLPSDVQLDTPSVVRALLARMEALGLADSAIRERAAAFTAHSDVATAAQGASLVRTPFYCSGCPHNRSTKIPDGSMASAGIGCHGMASLFVPNTLAPTQMGAEGATWIGMSRFTKTPHIFQNLGDGTYSHSGILAIRAARNAGVNITYKILYNDAVAMTGGQPIEGQLTVDAIAAQVVAEGVRHIALVSDEPEKYGRGVKLPNSVNVHHRKELDRIQREMRETEGVTVIIYDQTCASEKRRRRKRGAFPNPQRRAFINERVCEGCGDCSVKANCVSIQPKDTPEGRKRVIDQSSCNKDLSCIEGFCPSFVTVHGAEPRKRAAGGQRQNFADAVPVPQPAPLTETFNVLINGVGGTGVVTIGAVLGMAAHMEGNSASIFDMTGLAQKGGTVFSHLRLAPGETEIHGSKIGVASADLVLGCDLVVSAGKESLSACRKGHTRAVVNSHLVPTGAFQLDPDIGLQAEPMQRLIGDTVGEDNVDCVDARGLALTLLGDTIGANMFMVGYALQRGLVPISLEAVEAAVRLNGVAIDLNLDALGLGRLAAHDPQRCIALLDAAGASAHGTQDEASLDAVVERRVEALTSYQDAAYAERYRALVARVRRAESEVAPGSEALAHAVARYLHKVMAYKDEYEVARLYSDGVFEAALAEQFEDGYTLTFHLAPPWFAARDPSSGLAAKREYGPWMLGVFRFLAGLKGLRGGPFDVFAMSAERREERRIREDYIALVERLIDALSPANHAFAVELAEVPERIRGYGHVKEAHITRANAHREELLAKFWNAESPADAPHAVEEVSV